MVDRLIYADTEDMGSKKMRSVCKSALDEINNIKENCPIFLEKFTLNLCSHYILLRDNKRGGTHLPETSYGDLWSAFTHLHHMDEKLMSAEFRK